MRHDTTRYSAMARSELVHRIELQLLDAAAVLERVEQYLDFPARAVPVDELDRLFWRLHQPVAQQSPLHGLDARGHIDFAGQHHAGLHRAALVVGQFGAQHAQLLAHPTCLDALARGHVELDSSGSASPLDAPDRAPCA